MHLCRRDLLIAVVIGVVQVVGTGGAAQEQPDARPADLVSLVLLLAGPVALLLLRARPEVPLAVSLGALVTYLSRDYANGPIFLAFVVSLVACVLARRRIAAALAVVALEVGVLTALATDEIGLGEVTGATAWVLTVVAVSEVVRTRREGAGQARQAAEQERLRLAGEERLQVARELHDVLAHSISLISVQAGVALHLFDEQPEQARTALVAIKQASGDGLRDLRRTLDVLREQPARIPTPDLSELDRLIDGSRSAGLEVTCAVEGLPRELPAPVGLAAYRVVQESLTNVSRHSATGRARVRVAYAEDALDLQVDDDGPATSSSGGPGHGLQGMRERVTALGGRLATGTRSDGGFSVHATLPT